MKWEEGADLDDIDEDDRAAFEGLRKVRQPLTCLYVLRSPLNCCLKELRSLMDSVLSIDQDLVVEAIRTHALQTLQLHASGTTIKWNDAELAIYLIFIFGEINKSVLALPSVTAIHGLTCSKVQRKVDPLSAKHPKFLKKDVKRSTTPTFR